MKIIATLLIRNDEEIIEDSIQHHLDQGVSQFIAINYGSTDGTIDILNQYSKVVKIVKLSDRMCDQNELRSYLASIAFTHNPDWVFDLNVDEYWKGFDFLSKVPNQIMILRLSTFFSPQNDDSTVCRLHLPMEDLTYDKFNSSLMPYYRHDNSIINSCRIIRRSFTKMDTTQGNYDIVNCKYNQGCSNQITIDYYPIRSYSNFENKVAKLCEIYSTFKINYNITTEEKKWCKMYLNGNLLAEYNKYALKKQEIKPGLKSGKIKEGEDNCIPKYSWCTML